MTRDDDARLVDWIASGPHHGRDAGVGAALAAARALSQRPAWQVRLTGGTIAAQPESALVRYAMIVLAAVLLTGLLIGGLVAGGLLPPHPAPSILAIEASASPAQSQSLPAPHATGLVAYTVTTCGDSTSASPLHRCSTTGWLAVNDGSRARQLLGVPMGWSADGSRLLLQGGTGLILADATGSPLAAFTIFDSCTKDSSCAEGEQFLCAFPCTLADGFALSPDGSEVAFVRGYANDENATVLAVLDLGSGTVTELASTRTTNPPTQEHCSEVSTCQGDDETPRWSPGGNRIAFARQTMSPEAGTSWTVAAIYVVDPDGGNLRRVTPIGFSAFDPGWSPDGSLLVFTGSADQIVANADVWTIDLGGSSVKALTNDAISAWPNWTADGRVAFIRQAGGPAPTAWIAHADGGNQARLRTSLAELTAAGCRVCVFPSAQANDRLETAYWQPSSP